MDKIRKQFPITAEKCADYNDKIVVMVGDISHGIFSNYKKTRSLSYFF